MGGGVDGVGADPERGLTDELVALLFGLMRRSNNHHASCLMQLGLSMPQGHALRRLVPGRPLPQNQLAEVLQMDPSNLTSVLSQLETRGLIQRRVSEHDRRVRAVALTEAGQEVRDALLNCMLDSHPVVSELSGADRLRLRDLLRQLELGASRPAVH